MWAMVNLYLKEVLIILNHIKTFTNKKFLIITAVLCCFLWGSAFPAVKIGYKLLNISNADIPSELLFAGYRFTLAGIIVLIISALTGNNILKLSKKNTENLFLLGIIQTTLQYIFFYIGLANTTGVKGSIMNSTGAFFSVILAHFIYKNDKLSLNKVIGCLLGFAGVIIINFNTDLLIFSFSLTGDIFIITAAFIFSIGSIYGKKLSENLDVTIVTGYNLFIGGIVLVILGLISGGRVVNFTISSSLLLFYMAIISSAAFSLWTLLLKYNKVGTVSVFNFLIPVFGTILSSIFLGENIFQLKNIIALLLVCIGIWSVNKSFDNRKLENSDKES